jgi:hypothetical protein
VLIIITADAHLSFGKLLFYCLKVENFHLGAVKKPLVVADFIIPDLSVCCISNKIGPAKQDLKPELRSKHQLQNVDVMLRVYIIFSGGAQIRE